MKRWYREKPLKDRRRWARFTARQERGRRKARKRKASDPRRLWPPGTDQREDYDAFYSGDFNRWMKRIYRETRVDALVGRTFAENPIFGFIPKEKGFTP